MKKTYVVYFGTALSGNSLEKSNLYQILKWSFGKDLLFLVIQIHEHVK